MSSQKRKSSAPEEPSPATASGKKKRGKGKGKEAEAEAAPAEADADAEADEAAALPEVPADLAAEGWRAEGHEWVGRRVLRYFGKRANKPSPGLITRWQPPDDKEPDALWHMVHDDGDEEDLDEAEVNEAIIDEEDAAKAREAEAEAAEAAAEAEAPAPAGSLAPRRCREGAGRRALRIGEGSHGGVASAPPSSRGRARVGGGVGRGGGGRRRRGRGRRPKRRKGGGAGGKKKKKGKGGKFFMTPAERKAAEEAEAAEKAAEEAARREEEERIAREEAAVRAKEASRTSWRPTRIAPHLTPLLPLQVRAKEAREKFLLDQKKNKEALAQLNAGREVAGLFSGKPNPRAAAADADDVSPSEAAARGEARSVDVDDDLSLARQTSANTGAGGPAVPVWFEEWPWDAPGATPRRHRAAGRRGAPGAPRARRRCRRRRRRATARGSGGRESLRRRLPPPPAHRRGRIRGGGGGGGPRPRAAAPTKSGLRNPCCQPTARRRRGRWRRRVGGRRLERGAPREEGRRALRQPAAGRGDPEWLGGWSEAQAKHAARKGKGGRAGSDSDSYDSDEGCESLDEDDDAIELRNIIVLEGPCGAGKTAAAFACAAELGFKVIEVNAGMARSGKSVLRNFAEATQSHELGKWAAAAAAEPAALGPKKGERASQRKGKGKEATAGKEKEAVKAKGGPAKPSAAAGVAALFGRAGAAAEAEAAVPPPPKESKRFKAAMAAPKAAAATSKAAAEKKEDVTTEMSLVLFEEVDVVFEEDVGFYAALRRLACSSKCPIALTCNKLPACLAHLRPRTLRWAAPADADLRTYLAALCEARGVRVGASDLDELVTHHRSDLRRLLHTLQCWDLLPAAAARRRRRCPLGRKSKEAAVAAAGRGGGADARAHAGLGDVAVGASPHRRRRRGGGRRRGGRRRRGGGASGARARARCFGVWAEPAARAAVTPARRGGGRRPPRR